MLKALFGDKAFYKRLFVIMLPIMIQNGITNFVNMLDNIMVGQVGTAQMTGVSITNQLIFIFNLCIFGVVGGAGIYGAQFFGSKDYQGVRFTFRYKLLFSAFITAIGIGVFLLFGPNLLRWYMQGESGITDPELTMQYAKEYLNIMLFGLLPFAIVQGYSSTLRESGNPNLPMLAGVAAVLVNLVFNYILIFGHFGAPTLGVKGAAIATVISRYVELVIVALCTHLNTKKYPFMKGSLSSLHVPSVLARRLFLKALPLMINETIWSAGVVAVNIQYSVKGLDAIAALNISQTFWNVFSVAYLAVGVAIGVIIGQLLGANQLKEAKQSSYKLITFSFLICTVFSIAYFVVAPFIPMAYNTEPEIREIATRLMQISAIVMPFDAICHAAYFTMRSGGKMLITFMFDCGFMWLANVFVAFLLCRFTAMPFILIFAIVQAITVGKAALAIYLVRKDFWVKNIISV